MHPLLYQELRWDLCLNPLCMLVLDVGLPIVDDLKLLSLRVKDFGIFSPGLLNAETCYCVSCRIGEQGF